MSLLGSFAKMLMLTRVLLRDKLANLTSMDVVKMRRVDDDVLATDETADDDDGALRRVVIGWPASAEEKRREETRE